MKIAKVERPKGKPKGKQHGYHIAINQIRYKSKMMAMDDVKIFEAFISASAKEGKEELAKALIEISKLGIS